MKQHRNIHTNKLLRNQQKNDATASSPKETNNASHDLALKIKYSSKRTPGTESIRELTPQQRQANYMVAAVLFTFVSSVFYYSMNAVGKAEGGMDALVEEASYAKKKSTAEEEVEELLKMEDVEDAEIALAAPKEVAEREEARLKAKHGDNAASNDRPLWKKIVFFWRRN